MADRKLTTQDIADTFDVDPVTVRRWCVAGCPHSKAKGKPNRYDDAEVASWLKANNLSTEKGRPPEVVGDALESAKIRKENALARKHELFVEKEEGKLVAKSEVEQFNLRKIAIVRNGLLGLGARLSPLLEGMDGAERQRIIDDAVTEMLKQFAGA